MQKRGKKHVYPFSNQVASAHNAGGMLGAALSGVLLILAKKIGCWQIHQKSWLPLPLTLQNIIFIVILGLHRLMPSLALLSTVSWLLVSLVPKVVIFKITVAKKNDAQGGRSGCWPLFGGILCHLPCLPFSQLHLHCSIKVFFPFGWRRDSKKS